MFEVALPPKAQNITPQLPTFEREGKDGNEIIMPLFSSDYFFGEVLEGNWVKGDDAAILGPHTQLISGGELQLTGKSHSAGDADDCWIRSKSKLLMKDGVIVDVHLKLPNHSAANYFWFGFVLSPNVPSGAPWNENDCLYCVIYTDNSAYSIYVRKIVGGAVTSLANGTVVTNAEGTFRIKFNESGLGYTNIYFHDGSGSVDESEDEIADSPFSLDLNFDNAYVSFQLNTAETTNRTVVSEKVTVTYPFGSNISQLVKFDAPRGDKAGVETLFTEAEDATLGAGVTTSDLDDDSGTSVLLNSQNEYVRYAVTGLLSQGRYLALFRIKDTAQVASDVQLSVYNSSDATYLNVENTAVLKTVEGTYKVYELLFDVDSEDAGDTIYLQVLKATATANSVYVDWLRVVPYDGFNGECICYDTQDYMTFDKRVELTLDSDDIDDILNDFPVLLLLSSSCGINNADMTPVFDELGDNSLKIAVTTSDGKTQCYVEVVSWDSVGEVAELWVRVPKVLASSDTTLYLYYDNNHVDNSEFVGVTGSVPAQNVWDSNFKMVQHMNDATTSTITDSTSNGNDGAKLAANEPIEAAGQIGKAQDYDNSDDTIRTGNTFDFTTEVTVMAWVKADTLENYKSIICKRWGAGDPRFWLYIEDTSNKFYWNVRTPTGAATVFPADIADTGTHFLVGRWKSGEAATLDIDTTKITGSVVTGTLTAAASNIGIGCMDNGGGNIWDGFIDEVQISNIKRSDAWVGATYETQNDNLITYGSEESYNGQANWLRVFDPDHLFVGDLSAENGLLRLLVDEAAEYGVKLFMWNGQEYNCPLDQLYLMLTSDSKNLKYPFLKNVRKLSTEEICFDIRLEDSAVQNSDYYADLRITVKRGCPHIQVEILSVYPIQDIRTIFQNSTTLRFGFVGDAETHDIGDDDLAQDADNTTFTDNFLVAFDNAGTAVLAFVACNIEPDSKFQASDGGDLILEDYTPTNIKTAKIFVGLTPFSRVSSLFAEAEDETITAAARLYMDGAGEDTITENDGVWVATTNCAKDENNLAENSVGSACVEITSSGAGAVVATGTPAAPLGKLTKFDNLIVYLHGTPDGGAVTIRLVDADGDSVTKSQAITGSATQYTIALPHSATDLQGWTQVGTYDFTTFTELTVEWTAAGAGELVYIDGLHFYIGTTTARGRGETLSGSSAVVLDAQNEEVYQAIAAIEDELPDGRYLVLVRAKDTDQVASDLLFQNYNTSDASWLNQENANTAETLTSAFKYYQQVIDIESSHYSDTVRVPRVVKNTVTENTIFVDYVLVIPIGNGQSFPQDCAHASLRKIGSQRQPVNRRET